MRRLLECYPEFPRQAREELAHWVSPERQQHALEALRRSGVPIPMETQRGRERSRTGSGS